MSPRELFDVLDCAGRRTGELVEREAAHAGGVWHGAFHCCILYEREGTGYALFQLRSRSKQIAPGRFDVSVGGHYSTGEGPEDAGPREISEELGLDISFARLVPLGKRVYVHCFTPGIRECEFQDIYLLPMERRPDGVRMQDGEVDALLELSIEQGIDLFCGTRTAAEGLLILPTGEEHSRLVTAADFVPAVDQYYLGLLQLARRYFQGERTALAI